MLWDEWRCVDAMRRDDEVSALEGARSSASWKFRVVILDASVDAAGRNCAGSPI
jgi:hypothetical protein